MHGEGVPAARLPLEFLKFIIPKGCIMKSSIMFFELKAGRLPVNLAITEFESSAELGVLPQIYHLSVCSAFGVWVVSARISEDGDKVAWASCHHTLGRPF